MELEGLRIGFAITGSHCTYQEVWPQIERLASLGADIYPIASKAAAFTDTRFGRGEEMIKKFEQLTGKTAIIDLVDAEPIGPRKLLDLMVIAPCSVIPSQAGERHYRHSGYHGQAVFAQRRTFGFGHIDQRRPGNERQEHWSAFEHTQYLFCAFWPG